VIRLSTLVPLPQDHKSFSGHLVVEIVQADGKKDWRTASVQCSVDKEEKGIADFTWKEHHEWQFDADELTFLRSVVGVVSSIVRLTRLKVEGLKKRGIWVRLASRGVLCSAQSAPAWVETDTVVGYQGKAYWCNGIVAFHDEHFRGGLERFMSSGIEYFKRVHNMYRWDLHINASHLMWDRFPPAALSMAFCMVASCCSAAFPLFRPLPLPCASAPCSSSASIPAPLERSTMNSATKLATPCSLISL